jgi:hypothetical protein
MHQAPGTVTLSEPTSDPGVKAQELGNFVHGLRIQNLLTAGGLG